MLVDASDIVSIFKAPDALSLWLVVIEVAAEEIAVALLPLSACHLTLSEISNVLLIGLSECVGALAVLLSAAPVSRVEVLILVRHHTFTMALAVAPVAVVGSHARVGLFTDTASQVLLPGAVVDAIVGAFFGLEVVDVFSAAVAQLLGQALLRISLFLHHRRNHP